MAQYLYCNPNPATQARATLLGCGWMPAVPAQFVSAATAPCAIVSGAGLTAVVSDSTGQATAAAVTSAAAPIVAAEAAANTAAATANANADTLTAKATTALTGNATYLGIASPTTAQAITQVAALTRQVDALIRLAVRALDTTAGT